MEPEQRFNVYEEQLTKQLNKRLKKYVLNFSWLATKILNNDFKHKDREKVRLVPLKDAEMPNNYRTKKMTVAFLRIKLRIKRTILVQTSDSVLTVWQVKKKIQILETSRSNASRRWPRRLKKLRSHTQTYKALTWTPRPTAEPNTSQTSDSGTTTPE